jgi:hypothetical protein
VLAAPIIRAIALIALMTEEGTFETPVNFYETTRRSIPGDSYLYTHRRENLKSHTENPVCPSLRVQFFQTHLMVSCGSHLSA